ncbi:MAG: acetylglutamate kinase [Dehalococcoidia bacterium]|nr:acetylglutamate kinase [Dehalococcoidia bacterium]
MQPIVIKIGGSTLGNHDTTLEDLVKLQKQGTPLVVIHGGGREVSEWLTKLGIPTRFTNGLRVTDAKALKVAVAVLSGLVNKELVVAIQKLTGKAVGLSGIDGNLLQASIKNPNLGYVGEITSSNPSLPKTLLDKGYMPVIAPISYGMDNDKITLLNVNGDAAAGEIAAALSADRLIFLTDVDGVYSDSGKILSRINIAEAKKMIDAGTASGGMIPKIEACIRALATVPITRIINGKTPHALLNEINNGIGGTTIATE